MNPLKVVGVVIGGAAVLAAVIFGGWQAGWWFKTQNNNRQAHLIRNGYSNQQTLRDEITKHIGDYQDINSQVMQANGNPAFAYLGAQAHAVLNIVCQEAAQVTGDQLPAGQANFVSDHCLYGEAK